MWLIFRTMPGGAGGGPGAVVSAVVLMIVPAERNSPLMFASPCTWNPPVTNELVTSGATGARTLPGGDLRGQLAELDLRGRARPS